MHWENQIQTHLERARRRVAEMGDPQSEEASPREKQSRARARRERLEKSLEELEKLRTLKAARSPHKRVSITDPEARIMKQPDGGLALSYNAQLSTDASHGLIVGVRVTQAASDWEQLSPALEQIGQRLQQPPKQIVADAGYTTRGFLRKEGMGPSKSAQGI